MRTFRDGRRFPSCTRTQLKSLPMRRNIKRAKKADRGARKRAKILQSGSGARLSGAKILRPYQRDFRNFCAAYFAPLRKKKSWSSVEVHMRNSKWACTSEEKIAVAES